MIFMEEIERHQRNRLDKIHMKLLNDKRFAMVNFEEVHLLNKYLIISKKNYSK